MSWQNFHDDLINILLDEMTEKIEIFLSIA